MTYSVPELSYDYAALSPAISADIMQLHHQKHHHAYVDKLNAALKGIPQVEEGSLEPLLARIDELPEHVRTAVRNNGGGHLNHSLFWQWMSPDGGGEPTGELQAQIIEKYGSFQAFVDAFSDQAAGLFGSGWVWLQPNLEIITTPNQDNPIMTGDALPILGLDVWEHAYYLDYKNVRAEYIRAWWDVVNWQKVSTDFSR